MNKVLTFPHGGVHPADQKLSAQRPIQKLELPQTAVIPVSQHIGAPAQLIVKAGDKVKTGQLLAKSGGFISANTHSSASGIIAKIDKVIDISGYPQTAVFINVENDEWIDGVDLTADIKNEITASPDEIRQKVADAGIVGLGGATFPSHVKLSAVPGKSADILCINGAECEPFLTSDHRLMLEKGREIIVGIRIVMTALNIKRALVGIEYNKPDAIEHLRKLIPADSGIEIHALKTLYPQGGERQLVKALVNREIPPPPKGLPIDVGCVVFNVGTIYAIYEAVQKNKPLMERVVTISGTSLKEPGNYLVRLGSSIGRLIEKAGGLPEDTGKIICGGPMMGKAVAETDIPVTKGISGIWIVPEDVSTRNEARTCIRCAKCVSTCPLGLEPYLLKKLTEKQLWDRAEAEKITSCCECGCCQFICPSNIPLLDYMKLGKSIVNKIVRARSKK